MAILREKTVWQKPRTGERYRGPDLTPEEQTHLRAAIRVLFIRNGGWRKLAELLRVKPRSLWLAAGKRGRPSAGLAIRVARLAGVPIEDVLSGAWPKPGSCPMCGRNSD